MKCIIENCTNNGKYEEGQLCIAHKNHIKEQKLNKTNFDNIPLIDVYCNKCNEKLNCASDLQLNCSEKHLCKNCDKCVCGIENKKYMHYLTCQCFTICQKCINTYKSYE